MSLCAGRALASLDRIAGRARQRSAGRESDTVVVYSEPASSAATGSIINKDGLECPGNKRMKL